MTLGGDIYVATASAWKLSPVDKGKDLPVGRKCPWSSLWRQLHVQLSSRFV